MGVDNHASQDCGVSSAEYEAVSGRQKNTFSGYAPERSVDIRCIALDLDYTTLNSRGHLSGETRRALECAIGRGIHIVIASGRALNSLPAEIREIPGIRYAVTSNGAAVYDLQTGKCLKQYKLTETAALAILQLTEGLPLALEAFIDGKPYAQEDYVADPVKFGTKNIAYVQNTREPVPEFRKFLAQNIRRLDCIDLVVGDPGLKAEMWKALKTQVTDIYLTSSIPQLLEVSYKDCGKHSGVKFVLNRLGLPCEALMAFGDGDNDAQMLAMAGIGVAVANASEACKAAANRIALSNDEDGVAREIFRLLDGNRP